MNELAVRVFADERGMTTAEYAIGTCTAGGFAALLYKLLTSDVVSGLLMQVIQKAFSFIL